jgi:hypothetical protein
VSAYIELPIDEETTLRVDVTRQQKGLVRAGATDAVLRATQRFDEAMAQVVRLGGQALARATAAANPPDRLSVELGLKLTAKTGFVVAESTGEAHFRVLLEWSRTAPGTIAPE